MLQNLLDEIRKMEDAKKNNDEARRQIEECITYQKSIAIEKDLQAKMERVRHLHHTCFTSPKRYATLLLHSRWGSAWPTRTEDRFAALSQASKCDPSLNWSCVRAPGAALQIPRSILMQDGQHPKIDYARNHDFVPHKIGSPATSIGLRLRIASESSVKACRIGLYTRKYVRCWEDMHSCPEQASTQLDALGDHQKLYNELTQAEAQQRKLTQEQVSDMPESPVTGASKMCWKAVRQARTFAIF